MKKSLLVVVAVAMLVGLFGCTPPPAPTAVPPTSALAQSTKAPDATKAPEPTKPAPTAAPAGPKVLRINLGTWPDTIDPQKESFVNEIAVTQLIYEGLVRLDPKGNVVPGAAEKWEAAADGLSMTFTLRAGLKRADGTPLTAKDFEYAYKRTVDPRVLGEYNNLIDDVAGAVEARSLDPKSSAADIQKALDNVGVKATDDKTLKFTFKNKTGYFLMIASTWVGWPSDPKKVEKDPESWWNKADGHNGNGAWKIAKYEESKVITFVPNPNYYGPKPKLDRIELYWITDSQVSFPAYVKGELDVIGLAAEDKKTVDADPTLKPQLFIGDGAGSFYMGMNNNKPPFTDKNVRKAFAQAFNRDAWVNDILQGAGKPYRSWIPAGLPGSDPEAVQLPFDAKAAVKTLIDAGYGAANSTADKPVVDCKKLGEVRLTYGGTPRNHARNQWIAGQLASVFNCPITLDPVDPTVFTAMVKNAKTAPQYFQLGWIQDYPHPQNWLFIMTCDGLFANRIGYCNKDFDALIAKANSETDQAKALDLYKQAQKIMVNDYPGMMNYMQVNWYMVKPYVIGLTQNYGTSDSAWPGQYGPIASYDIDLSKVPANYPKQ